MNKQLANYQKMIDKLPIAARAIILAAILGLVFVIWYYSLWQDLSNSLAVNSQKIATLEKSIDDLNKQLESAKAGIDSLGAEKDSAGSRLLPPNKTDEMLQNLLTASNRLVLLELNNMPIKEVVLPSSNMKLYEHGVMIKFLGDYFATMQYLKTIESLKWKIFWDKFEYKVLQYPNAEITLYLHTLSNYEDWIHV